MLGKMFFNAEPYNPRPNFDGSVITLSGGEKYDDNTIWSPGRYRIVVQAGSVNMTHTNGQVLLIPGGLIEKELYISDPFIIKAYCGGSSSRNYNTQTTVVGTNPYTGAFKVNGQTTKTAITPVTHIFGNAGSCGAAFNEPSSGNCLGDGARVDNYVSSAGSCLHIMPVNGVFGTDYYYAFHTTGAGGGRTLSTNQYGYTNGGGYGGSGGAYGGGASGNLEPNSAGTVYSSVAGGSTPYGNGGAGVSGSNPAISGNNGTGIGHGYAGIISGSVSHVSLSQLPHGAAAFFNGTGWEEITTLPASFEDGKIIVQYLSAI